MAGKRLAFRSLRQHKLVFLLICMAIMSSFALFLRRDHSKEFLRPQKKSSRKSRKYKFLPWKKISFKGAIKYRGEYKNRKPTPRSSGSLCSGGFRKVFLNRSSSVPSFPEIYDQGQVGSCQANALAMAMRLAYARLGFSMNPSRYFIYYIERFRCLETSDKSQCGAGDFFYPALLKYGYLEESEWPYSDPSEEKALQPPSEWRILARRRLATTLGGNKSFVLQALTNVDQVKDAINNGIPVIAAFKIYEHSDGTTNVYDDGTVDFVRREGDKDSAHAVLLIGYSECNFGEDDVFYFLNSWGSGWGENGIGKLPKMYFYAYNNMYFSNPSATPCAYTLQFAAPGPDGVLKLV